jgi:hypothetical protein
VWVFSAAHWPASELQRRTRFPVAVCFLTVSVTGTGTIRGGPRDS